MSGYNNFEIIGLLIGFILVLLGFVLLFFNTVVGSIISTIGWLLLIIFSILILIRYLDYNSNHKDEISYNRSYYNGYEYVYYD
jgi:protein-S-isoprenylcysteine O-methyltransferase Ste14